MSETPSNSQIILAAVGATGPKPTAPSRKRFPDDEAGYQAALAIYTEDITAWDQAFKANARDIKVLTSPKSRVVAQLNALDKAIDENNGDGKVFIGTVTGIAIEERTTRAIVTLYTGTDRAVDGLPAGCESVRTERTDNPDGRAIARATQLLIGHRVTVYVELEAIRGGSTKVRVLRHIEDNGVDAAFDAATATVTPRVAAA